MVEINAQNTILGIVAIAVIVLGLYGTGLLAVTGTPDCQFTEDDKTCEYDVTIPEGEQMTEYQLLFRGESVPGPWSQPTSVEPTSTLQGLDTDDDSDTYIEKWYYAFKSPQSLRDVTRVRLNVTMQGEAQADDRDESDAWTGIEKAGILQQPYPSNGINTCRRSEDENCDWYDDQGNLDKFIWRNRYGDGVIHTARFYSTMQKTSLQEPDLWSGGDEGAPRRTGTEKALFETSGDATETGEFFSKDEQLFFLVVEDGTREGGESSHELTQSEMQYQSKSYPTNLRYKVGDETLRQTGIIREEQVRSADISEQINDACNRAVSDDECRVTITLQSDKPGNLYVDTRRVTQSAITEQNSDEDESGNTSFLYSLWSSIVSLLTA